MGKEWQKNVYMDVLMDFTAYPEPSILPGTAVLVLSLAMTPLQIGYYLPSFAEEETKVKREKITIFY